NKLAPGRIDFGIGTGFTGRRAMGLGAVRLADMEEYIRVVTELLRGDTVETELEGKRRLIRLLDPQLGLINTQNPIGLYVAASGPRARRLTAKLGAAWINTVAAVAGAIADLEDLRRLARGHSPDRTDAVVLSGGCIPQPGQAGSTGSRRRCRAGCASSSSR
ncbi:MAG TPA: LLM class flavin-dependent oxidoreductase, partial [Stellaceae bacterium]